MAGQTDKEKPRRNATKKRKIKKDYLEKHPHTAKRGVFPETSCGNRNGTDEKEKAKEEMITMVTDKNEGKTKKDTRFKPGNPGGPGRPKKEFCIPDILRKISKEPYRFDPKGKRTVLEAICRKALEQAAAGDKDARKWVADRMEGRAVQPTADVSTQWQDFISRIVDDSMADRPDSLIWEGSEVWIKSADQDDKEGPGD